LGLADLIRNNGLDAEVNFEAFYDDLVSSNSNENLVSAIDSRIFDYFSGLSLPSFPTIYDYLVLSLREKDIIATFNWDPFLLQAFRRNLHLKRLPQLAFLHGNVGLGLCYEDRRCGYIGHKCGICGKDLKPSNLLYPVRHKNYNEDVFIKGEWERLRWNLESAYYFTIFGYSTPITDIEAKNLMIEVWQKNKSLKLAEIDIVDVKARNELENAWNGFTYSHHYSVTHNIFNSYLFYHPRRSCEAFFDATLMCRPLKDNPFPKFDTLQELQDWVLSLIKEEDEYEKSKTVSQDFPSNNITT
jgi:hypothetical protein